MNYEKIYRKNLDYLKLYLPNLYEKVFNEDISDMELILNEDESHNIRKKGELIYPNNTKAMIDKQVHNFLEKPSLFYVPPRKNEGSRVSKYTDKIVSNILDKSPLKYGSEYVYHEYKTPQNVIPYLILFGVGTGEYLENIMKKKNILNLVIVDKDYSFFKISMHLVDWTKIFNYFSKRSEYSFVFITGKEETAIAYEIINAIYACNGMYSFYTQYLTHINSTFIDNIKNIVAENMFHAQHGWGFFEDEKLSLQHTLSNLKNSSAILKPKERIEKKFIVIGSGPSLDDDINKIKLVKDNVFIISCGTSLRTLWKNDIYPDLHIEIERNLVTYHDLINIDKNYLKQISLICLNVLHPKVKTLFKESFLIARDNDAGSFLLKDIPHFGFANPTCVNGGINLAFVLGAKEIYLLGVDNGFKNPKKHHSKNTIHSDIEAKEYKEEMNYILKKVKGNFQSEVYSTPDFIWSKQRTENCINFYQKVGYKTKIYNCSDGAYIRGAVPIKFDVNFFIKDLKDLKVLYSQFDEIDHKKSTKEIINYLENEREVFHHTLTDVTTFIKKFKIREVDDMLILLDESYQIINKLKKENQIVYSFLSGSFKIIYSFSYCHLLASQSGKDENMKFCKEITANIEEFLNYTYKMYLKIIQNKYNF